MRRNLQDSLSSFAAVTDSKVGLIRNVEILKLSEADPYLFIAHAEPCDTTTMAGIKAANRGAACSIDAEAAIVRACGESIERYCSAFVDADSLQLATLRQLERRGHRALPSHAFFPFSDGQRSLPDFPFEFADADRELNWVSCISLDGGEVHVPASCIYVPYRFRTNVEPFTHMPISTGLAAGRTLKECIEKGICEIVERDALMIVWHARIPAPRIDPLSCRGVAEHIDALLDCVRSQHARWSLNLLTLDIDIPVISAALVNDQDPPLTSFGIAASADPRAALAGALEEALLTRSLLNRTDLEASAQTSDLQSARTLRTHLLAHARSPTLRERMDFMTELGPLVRFSDIASRSASARDAVLHSGFMPVFKDITTSDVRDVGLRVARTLIGGLQPLDNDHRWRHIGGERLLSVPRLFGRDIESVADLNPDPHPFP